MDNIVLFDDQNEVHFRPLTFTRPISYLRIGILTIKEKWEHSIHQTIEVLPQTHLLKKYAPNSTHNGLFVNSRFLPSKKLIEQLQELEQNQVLKSSKNEVIAFYVDKETNVLTIDFETIVQHKSSVTYQSTDLCTLNYSWDLFLNNHTEIENDLQRLKSSLRFISPSSTNTIIGNEVYIEEGAKVEASILNAATGPIFISKNAEVMEGSMIRGPFALCEGGVVKMGAKIYGATTIGPYCKVGGEIGNSILLGYSNKGHDGYLGNSIIGEWCNLGADTNTSNLKNNYGHVKVWSYKEDNYVNSHLQFLGLIMGDHSKSGINTMFNTGTTVGIFSNIFGGNFPEKYIPNYSWGSLKNWETHQFDKAIMTAKKVMQRRNIELSEEDIALYKALYDMTNNHNYQ